VKFQPAEQWRQPGRSLQRGARTFQVAATLCRPVARRHVCIRCSIKECENLAYATSGDMNGQGFQCECMGDTHEAPFKIWLSRWVWLQSFFDSPLGLMALDFGLPRVHADCSSIVTRCEHPESDMRSTELYNCETPPQACSAMPYGTEVTCEIAGSC